MIWTAWVLAKHTFLGFRDHRCSRMAAAISYYVLFSIVPLAIFVISVFGFVLSDEARREDLVDQVLEQLPLTQTEGRADVRDVLEGVQGISGQAAVISAVVIIWSSSAMFGAIRSSLNTVWGVEQDRPWFQGKLIDLAQVGVLTVVLMASMVLTGVLRAARARSADWFGPLAGESVLWEVPPILLPAMLALLAFFVLYRLIPASHPGWKEALTGAVVATVLFELLKNSFAIYVQNFNNYDVVYGALAGVLLFLFYTYLASNILLIGAEIARTVGELRGGRLAYEFTPDPTLPPVPVRMARAFKGLFVRQP